MPAAAATASSDTGVLASATLDRILTAQLTVAWAGEGGEEPRLGWWRTDLISEFGGAALFQRLTPKTWRWAVFQAAREAARRTDEALRRKEHDPDAMVSLYHLGFTLDEQLDEHLRQHKRSGRPPTEALSSLGELIGSSGDTPWSRERFLAWVRSHGKAEVTPTTAGRRLKGAVPAALDETLRCLVAALDPLADAYPLPHFRRNV